jgi:hypothetical protein
MGQYALGDMFLPWIRSDRSVEEEVREWGFGMFEHINITKKIRGKATTPYLWTQQWLSQGIPDY